VSTTRAHGGRLRHAFITPDLQGPPTGGTLFNAALIDALRRTGASVRQLEVDLAFAALIEGAADVHWVDSLYLDAMPALRAQAPDARLNLVVHYLPSLVSHGGDLAGPAHETTATERQALDAAGAFLVTSQYMRRELLRISVGERPVFCVEPGVTVAPLHRRFANASPHLLMLCNVTEGKGVLELLSALAERVRADDAFRLEIAGRLDISQRYAERCAAMIASHSELDRRVHLLGGVTHHQALALLGRADLLVSASRMESYGMALSEARAAGVPIVARVGGHAAAHVDAEAGGSLVADESGVTARLLELVREPKLLAECQKRARASRLVRSWDDAAADLLAQL